MIEKSSSGVVTGSSGLPSYAEVVEDIGGGSGDGNVIQAMVVSSSDGDGSENDTRGVIAAVVVGNNE